VRAVVDTLDIAPDRTRVGVVPYNEDVYNAFGINQYSNKEGVLEAICTYPVWKLYVRTESGSYMYVPSLEAICT
jgi:hypothetical protein